MKDYKISIVTPFHNVDMKMFQRAFDSMVNQTYGIDNIQWIIVVHNSDDEYFNALNELVKGHDSIILKVLKNDKHTPSSPRNYGMDFATGKYIGFLDGDDGFTPTCIETALNHIEKTNSQMLVFRREYELADENCMPFTELTLWNQTLSEIVIERGHFVKDIMFEGYWGFVTSRVYDREFLVKYNIRFSDDIPWAEDMHFCMLAYGHLDRVCYLPQFIGYHYFINGSSLVQSKGNKDGKTLIYYAEGFNKILATGLYYDIPINSIANGYITHLMLFIMGSQDITVEQIARIKEILRPYARMAEPLKPTKIFPKSDTEFMYHNVQMLLNMSPEEIMQEKLKRSAAQNVNEGTKTGLSLLQQILDDNKNTDIAKFGFDDAKRFLENVPITHYDNYAPLIDLTTKIGEKNIFTSYPILCYARTSGSMGQPKYIPCTEEHIKDFLAAFEKLLNGKKSFALFESLPHKKMNDSAYIDTISGVTLYYYFDKHKESAGDLFTSPKELLFPNEAVSTTHARLLFALLCPDVEQIIAPFTWEILHVFQYLEKNFEVLCNDIESGEISKEYILSDALREALNRRLTPNPERAHELRAIFLHSFDEPVAPKIWPKLNKIIAAGTGAFQIYTDKLRRYFGDIPHSNGIYAASEAFIATSYEDNDDTYVIQNNNCFFEYLPLNADKPVTSDYIEEGKSYELVVTNKSGLYRYGLDDIVTIVSARETSPVIKFYMHKHGKTSGVFFTESDVYTALKDVEKTFKFEIADFAFFPDEENDKWVILIEPDGKDLDIVRNISLSSIRDIVNFRLCQLVPEFAESLRDNNISMCEILFNQPETHMLYRDIERFRNNISPDQIKPVHFIEEIMLRKFFLKNILQF